MNLSLIDYIIIAIIVIISVLICYFSFWKNRKKSCHGCPYAKSCTSDKCLSVKDSENNIEENNTKDNN